MKPKIIIILAFFILMVLGIYARYSTNPTLNYARQLAQLNIEKIRGHDISDSGPRLKMARYVAHAGGEVSGVPFSNSLEAFNNSYKKGFRFFEADFNWTSDNKLVLIHDWDSACSGLFHVPSKRYTLGEYKKFKMLKNLTQMNFDQLAQWMRQHPDAYIVTDVKENNLPALQTISQTQPQLMSHIIPQIYRLYEYTPTRRLGFNNVILTLYQRDYNDKIVLDFVKRFPVAAITMPINRAERLPLALKNQGVFTYVHTVNDRETEKSLNSKGVSGFYTDSLEP